MVVGTAYGSVMSYITAVIADRARENLEQEYHEAMLTCD